MKISLVALSALLILTSCNCFKKVSKKVDTLKATTNPVVLSLKGDVVPFTSEVSFPAKFISTKATYKITPVMVFEGGELAGDPVFVQGEKVIGNYQVITSTGGAVKVSGNFPYSDKLYNSVLELRIEVKCTPKTPFLPLTSLKAAKGVSTIQNFTKPVAVAYAKDQFKRVITETKDASLMFKINSAVVSKKALNSEEIKMLETYIKESKANDRKTVSDVYTKAYASPDGPLNYNDKLSKNRAKTSEKALSNSFKKNDVSSILTVDALGEDWEGFKELVQASDIAEKDMILQILNMYNDPNKRDQEIKNMSSVFKVLADKILPQLRRSKLSVNVDVQGYTDEEFKAIVAEGNVKNLNVEEMLFAATLFTDKETKAKIYAAAADKYSNDWRVLNNFGAILFQAGEVAKAKEQFAKAAKLNANAPEVVNNLGVIAVSEKKLDEAKKYFGSILNSETPAKSNYGIVLIKQGNYSEAIPYLTESNKAVAQICLGDLAGAKESVKNCNCAVSTGVKAIIAAKEGDIKSAESLASGLKVNANAVNHEIQLVK